MAMFSLALNSTVTTTGASAMDLLATANNAKLMQCGFTLGAATASTYGLGRSANTPVQTSGVAVLAWDNVSTGLTKGAVAWGTAPTTPTNFLRRLGLPATIGAGFVWSFPYGVTLGTTAGMEFWNLATNSASVNVHFDVEE